MPELLLLRHGKSDWDAPGGRDADAERPLNARGRRAAAAMGAFLTATGNTPDAAVTSPAVRARTTLELAAGAGGWGCPVRVVDDLYGGGPEAVLAVVRAEPAATGRLLVVGHEPTWSTTVELLTGAAVRFPTATLACVELDDWAGAAPGTGTLAWLVPPRLVGDGR